MALKWQKIPGMETYEVSSVGGVRRSLDAEPAVNTFPGRVLRPDFASGYARVTLRHGERATRMQIHRLMAKTFLGEARPFAHVNHKNGDKLDNRLSNLEWCSPQENVRHAWDTGLCNPIAGERHGLSKLKKRDIEVICDARRRGVNLSRIAEVFGVTESNVSCICNGKTWRSV